MTESYKYLQKYETIDVIGFDQNRKMANKNKDIVLIQNSLPENFAVEDHFHDWLEITYLVEGEQLIRIKERSYVLSTGDFLMVNYNQLHESVAIRPCKKLTIQIKRSYLTHNLPSFDPEKIWCNSTTITTVEEYHRYKHLAGIFLEMAVRFKDQTGLGEIGFKGSLYNFFYHLIRDFSIDETGSVDSEANQNHTMNQIMSYIHKNYETGITLKDLSETFYLTPQYISKMFKEFKNMTFLETLNDIRLSHAVYDMINTDKKLVAICYESGFKNNKSFITAFKQKYGVTPSAYRQRSKK